MSPTTVKLLLFATAVGCVVVAALLSWQRRRLLAHSKADRRSSWWRGEPGPLNPGVGAGWLVFVLLNAFFSVTQPLLAAGLFVRAYVLRAMFLRKGR